MISFLIGEIKSALVWTKEIVILFAKWMFRWVLRMGMMGILLFIVGKGCSRVSAVIASRISVGNAPLQQNSAAPTVYQTPVSQEPRNYPENPPSSQTKTAEIRSAWSTLRYVGQDLMRWFQKR